MRSSSKFEIFWGRLPNMKYFEVIFQIWNIFRSPSKFDFLIKYTYYVFWNQVPYLIFFEIDFQIWNILRSSSKFDIFWGRLPNLTFFEVVYQIWYFFRLFPIFEIKSILRLSSKFQQQKTNSIRLWSFNSNSIICSELGTAQLHFIYYYLVLIQHCW